MKAIFASLVLVSLAIAACGSRATNSVSTVKSADATANFIFERARWTSLGTYNVQGYAPVRTFINAPVWATYLRFDTGYGGFFVSQAFVAPHIGPTYHIGYGVFAVNSGWGSAFSSIAFDVDTPYGGMVSADVRVSYTTDFM